MPEKNEYINDAGEIALIFDRIRNSRKRKRPLSKLNDLDAVRDELGKLYADVHQERTSARDFTRRAYVLGLIAQVLRMQQKGDESLKAAYRARP